jgi:hypothetical protein
MSGKIVSWSDGDIVFEVSCCAALMAALRKCPDWIKAGRGVSGDGWSEETRSGGGTSRIVSGW